MVEARLYHDVYPHSAKHVPTVAAFMSKSITSVNLAHWRKERIEVDGPAGIYVMLKN